MKIEQKINLMYNGKIEVNVKVTNAKRTNDVFLFDSDDQSFLRVCNIKDMKKYDRSGDEGCYVSQNFYGKFDKAQEAKEFLIETVEKIKKLHSEQEGQKHEFKKHFPQEEIVLEYDYM